jgi:ABC-2 type transport system ATP-binding protein
VLIFGTSSEAREAKQRVGFLPEQPYFYQHLTGLEMLMFYGDLFGLDRRRNRARAHELLEAVGLKTAGGTPISKFSKGMLQRIGLAQALVNDPDLVVLDEPLSGLDPVGRRDIRDLVLDLKARGKTIFFSSHILQDVEMICDRVAILSAGKLLRVTGVAEVLDRSVRWIEIQVDGITPEAARGLGLASVSAVGEKTIVNVGHEDELNRTITTLMSAGARVSAVIPMRLTLEDYFMSQVSGRGEVKDPSPGETGDSTGPRRQAGPATAGASRQDPPAKVRENLFASVKREV